MITSAAPIYKKQLQSLFPNKKIEVLLNGYFKDVFDLSILEDMDSRNYNDKFIISYAGLIHDFQPAEEFLEGYSSFLHEVKLNGNDDVELVFYGLDFHKSQYERVEVKCEELNVDFKSTRRLNQIDLYRQLIKSSVFLVFGSPTEERLAAKIFDYILLKRKIILFRNDFGILEKIISECNAGIAISTENQLKTELLQLYKEFKKNGKVSCETNNIEYYSRENQTKILSELIKTTINNK